MTASIQLKFLLGAAALLAVVTVAGPAWLHSSESAVRSNSLRSRLMASPGEEALVTQARVHAKNQIIERLLANELTLVESAAWFRYLNDNPPELRSDYRKAHAGDSDGEKLCRQVIAFAQVQARQNFTESQAHLLDCRLDNELNELLARGPIELPW
jgi:hypothetical protein